jgi:hypothetical protein
VTTDNRPPVRPGSWLGDDSRSSTAATAASPRPHVPGQLPLARPVLAEPSWSRVLLTTVELWVSRRLRRAGFLRRQASSRLSGNRVPSRIGRQRSVRRWRRHRLALAVVAAAAVALAVLPFTGAFSRATSRATPRAVPPSVSRQPVARARGVSPRPAAAAQSEAVAWITSQVSSAAIIGCYPAMCAVLQAQGVSASRLVALGSSVTGMLAANVIATLPSADQGLVNQYAPAIIASFGSGRSRIEVRAVAPGGAAAYQSALRTDLYGRKSAGSQLLRNPRLRFSAADATRVRAGQVDSRLLATLAALSSQFTLRVMAFADSSPGAPLLFREVIVASDGAGNGVVTLAAALAVVNAQESPYLPVHSAIVHSGTGQAALVIEFASPSPLGLLTTVLTADVQ